MRNLKGKEFTNEKELLDYSSQLRDSSLREHALEISEDEVYYGGKGALGHTVERLFFGYNINSRQEADFKILGRELKVAPLKRIKRKQDSSEIRLREGISAKERIVLTMIDYMKLAEEKWESNTMKEKIRLLLMFYFHESGQDQLDLKFRLIDFWEPSAEDMKIIKSDWERIQKKVLEGEAHNISEGDTSYLGACTKGSTAEKSWRDQPFNKEMAKQRAFSLKRSYVDSILEELLLREKNIDENQKVMHILSTIDRDIETAISRKFRPFMGKTAETLCRELDIPLRESKNFYRTVINKILVNEADASVLELEKAGIEPKIIRIDPQGNLAEAISFPSFDFIKLSQEEWDDSDLKTMLEEKKYLFVIMRMDCSNAVFGKMDWNEKMDHISLENILVWNMPMEDIENSARIVWERTKDVIINGIEFETVGKRRYNNLPKSSESETMHVRPHGKNAEDVKPLPNGETFTKQCFWFNKGYIEKFLPKK